MGDKTRSRGKRARKQKPTFGPALPLGMVRERREASTDADANVVDT